MSVRPALFYAKRPRLTLYIPLESPNRDNLVRRIKEAMPKGFTGRYQAGGPHKTTPIRRYLRLDDFAGKQGFNVQGLIREIANSFAELMSLLPIINDFTPARKVRAAAK